MSFFIDEWKSAHRMLSIVTSSIGAALMTLFTIWPDYALYLWGAMPIEIRTHLPENFATAIAAFIFAMSILSRLVKQNDLHEKSK